jgi:hypothetical protein
MPARICIIEECGQTLPANGTSEFCHQCRRGFYYWRRKPAAAIIHRKKQLHKLQDRFENMPEGRPKKRS